MNIYYLIIELSDNDILITPIKLYIQLYNLGEF